MALSTFLRRFEREEVPQQLADSSRTQYMGTIKALRSYFVGLRDDPRLRELSKADVKRWLRWRRTHSTDGTKREEPLGGPVAQVGRSRSGSRFPARRERPGRPRYEVGEGKMGADDGPAP